LEPRRSLFIKLTQFCPLSRFVDIKEHCNRTMPDRFVSIFSLCQILIPDGIHPECGNEWFDMILPNKSTPAIPDIPRKCDDCLGKEEHGEEGWEKLKQAEVRLIGCDCVVG